MFLINTLNGRKRSLMSIIRKLEATLFGNIIIRERLGHLSQLARWRELEAKKDERKIFDSVTAWLNMLNRTTIVSAALINKCHGSGQSLVFFKLFADMSLLKQGVSSFVTIRHNVLYSKQKIGNYSLCLFATRYFFHNLSIVWGAFILCVGDC